jgi:hypothetical protein
MQETENNLPRLLKVILILSFIGSSFNMFSGLQDAFSRPSQERIDSFREIFTEVKDESPESEIMIDEIIIYMENINLNIVNYGVARFMLNAISLIGLFLMYRRRQIGFAVYSGAQVFLLGVPLLFGGYSNATLSIIFFFSLFTVLFISLYASQLRYMRR